jgi:hypothetical protein
VIQVMAGGRSPAMNLFLFLTHFTQRKWARAKSGYAQSDRELWTGYESPLDYRHHLIRRRQPDISDRQYWRLADTRKHSSAAGSIGPASELGHNHGRAATASKF